MIGYFTIAALVFSFVCYLFIQDQDARKDNLGAWLTITFVTLFWPLTLPNMARKVVTRWLNSCRSQEKQSVPEASSAEARCHTNMVPPTNLISKILGR